MRSKINFDHGQEEASIDMTPMLDVVFIMLIFFIVSTTFIRDEGVDIQRPSAKNYVVQSSKGVTVALDSFGNIWLDQAQVSLPKLKQTMRSFSALSDKPSVLIKADQKSDTGTLIQVLDTIKDAGIEKVAVATKGE